MLDWSVDFDAPRYLPLLALLPAFWFIGQHSLGALTAWRRRAVLFFRLAVATLLIVALAEPNWLDIAPAMASGLTEHVWTIKELIEKAAGA